MSVMMIWCDVHEVQHPNTPPDNVGEGVPTCGPEDWQGIATVRFPLKDMPEGRKRVVRVLLYEGDEGWVDETLSPDKRSYIQPNRPYECIKGSVSEIARAELP